MSREWDSLREALRPLCEKGLCLAFSGGVDSAVVLAAAVSLHPAKPVEAVLFATQLHPPAEESEAKRLCNELHTPLTVVHIDEFADPAIMQNPPDRCYHCKKRLFEKLWERARAIGYGACADGTNADDKLAYRPGLRALEELSIESPLLLCGFHKAQVRALAAEQGLSVQKKPSTPCLATRLPYGTPITREALQRIDRGETWLKENGFPGGRVRLHGDVARIEVLPQDLPRFFALREAVVPAFKKMGFWYVTLDLEGFRSGSMDEPLGLKAPGENRR